MGGGVVAWHSTKKVNVKEAPRLDLGDLIRNKLPTICSFDFFVSNHNKWPIPAILIYGHYQTNLPDPVASLRKPETEQLISVKN